ncbi:lecithin retinol acyltransferase family protein [Phormidium yuhuli AB48]|uniref:Lecithin retinol acyltransferase family protein n=1 Tax=Phormidium yuhuli AB48 TaxID=2940671 RepID=A0ABY5AQN9_9CYAN|nr:lecithin retinol acyltransferase family protein [Phormidium yuhuli]USR91534.1 lecithin retinol acyltransferase family protein [Phormidium yuhuli AB48]
MARGDQIYVIRPFFNLDGLYEHHGIDCGDSTVIHYSKQEDEATVKRTSVATFSQGKPIYTRQYPAHYIAETTLQRAQSRLGERKYNLLFNNCEHFATWCKTGISDSKQVRKFAPLLATLNPDQLSGKIYTSFQDGHQEDAPRLLESALGEIKLAWDDLQPRYNKAVREMKSWDKVAHKALERHREDLARVALHRKREFRLQAEDLKQHLDRLAKMTETLVEQGKAIGGRRQ